MLPNVDQPATKPFWDATRESRLVVQRCDECGYLRWPPGPLCPECQSSNADWVDLNATGTLWSYATYHRAFSPDRRGSLPYSVALVEVDEGPRMYGMLLGDADSFRLDEPVRAVFVPVNDDVTMVHWQMARTVVPGADEGQVT